MADIKYQIHISYARHILAWFYDIMGYIFYLLYSALSKHNVSKFFPNNSENVHLLSSHLIWAMWWYVVVTSSRKHVLLLLYVLVVDYGKKGQEKTPVFIICYSTSIVTLPWKKTKKTRTKELKVNEQIKFVLQ